MKLVPGQFPRRTQVFAHLARHLKAIRPSRAITGVSASLLLSQLCMAATGLLSARWLGPAGKGLAGAALTWGILLGWVAGLGVAVAMQVRIAETADGAKEEATATAIGNAALYSATIGISVAILAYLPIERALAHLGPQARPAVALALLPLPLTVLAPILGYLQLALSRNRLYAFSLTLGPAITLASVLGLQWRHDLDPVTLIGCYLGGSLVAIIASGRKLPWSSARVNLQLLRHDIGFGIKLWMSGLLTLANLRLDVVIMSTLLTATDIGLYTAANNIMLPVTVVPAAISLLAAPRASRLQAREGQPASIGSIWSDTRLAFTASLTGGLLLATSAPIAVPLLLGSAYRPSVRIIWILIAGLVGRATAGVIVTGAYGMRRLKVGYVTEGIGFLITVVLLPLLIPRYGIEGAAITSTLSYDASALTAGYWLLRARRDTSVGVRVPSDEPSTMPPVLPTI